MHALLHHRIIEVFEMGMRLAHARTAAELTTLPGRCEANFPGALYSH
jgi:hypothetical protein